MIEIERKFLVTSENFKNEAISKKRILQGFLNRDPERTVRVRLNEDRGFLTVKGLSTADGLVRSEWEKEITKADAKILLKYCEEGVIEKIRYEVPAGKHLYEVDEFFGDNKGLVIAEVELESEKEMFEKPPWLGDEVTGQIKYYNSQLSIKPFKLW